MMNSCCRNNLNIILIKKESMEKTVKEIDEFIIYD
jgi:hypothetical protein